MYTMFSGFKQAPLQLECRLLQDSGHIQKSLTFFLTRPFLTYNLSFNASESCESDSHHMESSTPKLRKAAPHQNCFAKATWLRNHKLGADLLRERQEPMQENESTFCAKPGSQWFIRNGMKGTRWNDWYHECINVLQCLSLWITWYNIVYSSIDIN